MLPTEIQEQQTQSTATLKKIIKNRSKVACNKFGIYEVKEGHSSFPRTKEKFKSRGGTLPCFKNTSHRIRKNF